MSSPFHFRTIVDRCAAGTAVEAQKAVGHEPRHLDSTQQLSCGWHTTTVGRDGTEVVGCNQQALEIFHHGPLMELALDLPRSAAAMSET